jgi:hypothetical protein
VPHFCQSFSPCCDESDSPFKLQRSSLTSSDCDADGDDGFLDLLDEDNQDVDQVGSFPSEKTLVLNCDLFAE